MTFILASTKVWWYVSRSAGIVGWALCAASVLWGMALSTRALGRKPSAPWLLDLHRFIGGLAVTFVGVHLVSLMLDPLAISSCPSHPPSTSPTPWPGESWRCTSSWQSR
jgi:hypothetical protein